MIDQSIFLCHGSDLIPQCLVLCRLQGARIGLDLAVVEAAKIAISYMSCPCFEPDRANSVLMQHISQITFGLVFLETDDLCFRCEGFHFDLEKSISSIHDQLLMRDNISIDIEPNREVLYIQAPIYCFSSVVP